jgi:NADH-quinone oxidoreductase subunit E
MDSIIKRYPRSRSAIMPLLHYVQSKAGYVTNEGIEVIAKVLQLEAAEVTAVSTFYTQYKPTPVGEYHVGVCTNTLCAVMGGDAIFASLKDHYAPVVMANWEFYDNQTVESAKDLVDSMRAGNPKPPTRGPNKLVTWKEASAVLAGLNDGRAHEGVQAGEPTLLGLKLSKEGK